MDDIAVLPLPASSAERGKDGLPIADSRGTTDGGYAWREKGALAHPHSAFLLRSTAVGAAARGSRAAGLAGKSTAKVEDTNFDDNESETNDNDVQKAKANSKTKTFSAKERRSKRKLRTSAGTGRDDPPWVSERATVVEEDIST